VERAGFDVLERETVVLWRAFRGDFALARLAGRLLVCFLECLAGFFVCLLECLAGFAARATGRRDGRRALALTLRRDAAFKCFPLLWIVTSACGAAARPTPPRR